MNVTFLLIPYHTQSGASASAVVGALLADHNGNGRETEVQGEGVVGVQPLSRLAKSTSTPAVQSLKPRWDHAGSLRNDR